MSDKYAKLNSYSNKRFSEIISEGFYLFGKNWLTLIVPLGLFFIVSLVIKNFLIVGLEWQVINLTPAVEAIILKDPSLITYGEIELMVKYLILGFSSIFLGILIPNVFNVIAFCLVSNYLFNKFIDKKTKLYSEIKKALNGRILPVILLLGFLFSAGWIIFIPGIIIFGFYIFYVFTYHSDDSDHPLREARYLAKGEFWKIIGIFFINNLIILAFETIYQFFLNFVSLQSLASWYNPSTRDYGAIILYDFVINIVQLIFAPLLICFLTSLYAHLKTRKEKYLQYETPYHEIPQSYETPQKGIISGPGIYCPFCGKLIPRITTYCPHCGRELKFLQELEK
ncbi:MAG: zinc ribbon domain-containing protein [Candidatus Hermodarchaeota archaeon]